MSANQYIVLSEGEGLTLQSGPDRDLIFKVTGEDTGGQFDYFIVETMPKGGPPLHVHHGQEETIQVVRNGSPDPKVLGPLFEKYNMTLLGPPLGPD